MTVSSAYASTIAAANAQATANAAANSATSAVSATNTLASLAGNFNDFLSLLTTQLKNQDPSAPMDTNQFTSQLVQFTSVAEQITTNTTLGQLLTSSQGQQLSQATSLIGRQVSFTGGTLPLQGGAATLDFQSDGAQPVQVAVVDANGNPVHVETINAADGSNRWTWNGIADNGAQLPDGAYTVAVTAAGVTLPAQAIGTVTGAEQAGQGIQLKFGTAGVTFDKVVSMSGV